MRLVLIVAVATGIAVGVTSCATDHGSEAAPTPTTAPSPVEAPAPSPPETLPPDLTPVPATPEPELSAEAETYLADAIGLMRRWSINRADVDWAALEEVAYRVADGAESVAETHPAVRSALSLLRDDHSVFLTPTQAAAFTTGPAIFTEPVVDLNEAVGYVAIERYSGDIGDQADAYATSLAAELTQAAEGICGWIVDLRDNSGGNMWPMIAGLSPLIGTGQVGSFTYPDGTVEAWTLTAGAAHWDETMMTRHGSDSTFHGPVAVLIGPTTASSGEATAIAFHGRPDTMFFGRPTSGLTTSNEPLLLDDGALLILTMSVFTDREGHTFGQDIAIDPDTHIDGDPTQSATDWLTTHPHCRQHR